MAELRCEQISAAYGENEVLSGVDLVVPDGTRDRDPRRVGQRQDDAAAGDHGLRRAEQVEP